MDKGGSKPEQPDYAKLIPQQNAANRSNFDYQTAQSRIDSVTPTGTSTWSKSPQFNEAAYNTALEGWNAKNSQGTWIPGSTEQVSLGGDNGFENREIAGRWEGATGTGDPMPDKADFTTYGWTNTQAYSPDDQKMFDAQQGVKTGVAEGLPELLRRAFAAWDKPTDLSGAPGLKSGYNPQMNEMMGRDDLSNISGVDLSKLPGYENYTGGPSLQGGGYGREGFGAGPDAYSKVGTPGSAMRDWASPILSEMQRLQGKKEALNPWEYDQQGADAMYSQQTRYMDVDQAAKKKDIESRLGEQGFVPGTPAYNQALQQYLDTSNRAYGDARDRATLTGREFGNQAFDNASGNLQDMISNVLSGGKFGVQSDQARSDEMLSRAKFASGENQFDATNSLDRAKFGDSRQAQDFEQRRFMAGDSDKAAQSMWDNQNFTTERNNSLDATRWKDYTGATDFNNQAGMDAFDQLSKLFSTNQISRSNNNAADIAAGKANNEARTQFRDEAIFDEDRPLQQLLKALGISQPGALPGINTAQAGNLSTPDLLGAANQGYGNQVDSYNADVGSGNATMAAIAQALGAIFSDARMKENLIPKGATPKGIPLYEFSYRPEFQARAGKGRFLGVMAQDLLASGQAEAVGKTADGYYFVDYSKVQ